MDCWKFTRIQIDWIWSFFENKPDFSYKSFDSLTQFYIIFLNPCQLHSSLHDCNHDFIFRSMMLLPSKFMHRRLVGTFTCNLCVPQSSARFDIDPGHNSQSDPVHKVVFGNRDLHYCHCDLRRYEKKFRCIYVGRRRMTPKKMLCNDPRMVQCERYLKCKYQHLWHLKRCAKCFSAWKRHFERKIA